MTPTTLTPVVNSTGPEVLKIFKIIINFIWSIISYPIDIGGVTITIFGIMAFIFIVITLLSVFQLKIPSFRGSDAYGKFSTKSTTVKKGK